MIDLDKLRRYVATGEDTERRPVSVRWLRQALRQLEAAARRTDPPPFPGDVH
jgi:hypothetical protein